MQSNLTVLLNWKTIVKWERRFFRELPLLILVKQKKIEIEKTSSNFDSNTICCPIVSRNRLECHIVVYLSSSARNTRNARITIQNCRAEENWGQKTEQSSYSTCNLLIIFFIWCSYYCLSICSYLWDFILYFRLCVFNCYLRMAV